MASQEHPGTPPAIRAHRRRGSPHRHPAEAEEARPKTGLLGDSVYLKYQEGQKADQGRSVVTRGLGGGIGELTQKGHKEDLGVTETLCNIVC